MNSLIKRSYNQKQKIIMSGISKMDFKLERYKHINNEISKMNTNIHTYLNQFQTIATTIIVGAVLIFVNWKPLSVEPNIAILSIKALYLFLSMLSGFIVVRILAGVFSWLDYRKEETELLNELLGEGFRKKPSFGSFWRWDEFYSIIMVVLVAVIFIVISEAIIIPNIK